MKLRNKKTGEIRELPDGFFCGNNLKKICEEWEDYEEPKEYWFINEIGKVEKAPSDWLCNERDCRQEIGNRFETKEEAEKAVEKLKAWKRLKDKGLRFKGWSWDDMQGVYYLDKISFDLEKHSDSGKDLDLLFSGEGD